MKKSPVRPTFAVPLALAAILLPTWAHACSVCMGATDDHVVSSVGLAMLLMLGVTGTMLSSIAAFMIHLSRRARKFNQLQLDKKSKPGV